MAVKLICRRTNNTICVLRCDPDQNQDNDDDDGDGDAVKKDTEL